MTRPAGLAARLPQAPGPDADPDELYDGFVDWATDQGLLLYPHQEEALLEIVSGSHVIAATPTGSGKSLIGTAALFAALATGRRAYYTAPIKALVSEKFFDLVDIFGAGSGRHDHRRLRGQCRPPRSSAAPRRSWPGWRCAAGWTPTPASPCSTSSTTTATRNAAGPGRCRCWNCAPASSS